MEKIPSAKKRKRTDTTASNIAESVISEGENRYANERTVYVEGIPFTSTEEDILDFFKEAGKVLELRLPKWHDSNRLRGYGHVQFSSADEATKALSLNGNVLKDRYLKVERPLVPRNVSEQKSQTTAVKPPGCHTVFIKNLPYDCTEEDIKEAFQVFGKITNIRLALWGHTKQLKGFGYIDFKSEESAEIAVKKNGTITIKGRNISCDFETGAPKASFRTTEGKHWKEKKITKKKKV